MPITSSAARRHELRLDRGASRLFGRLASHPLRPAFSAGLTGLVAEARLSEREQTVDLDDDFDHVLEQMTALKLHCVHDERNDDHLGRSARIAVDSWRHGGDTHDFEQAMATVAEGLETHPEAEEHA